LPFSVHTIILLPFTEVYYFPVFLPAYFQCLFDLIHSFTSLYSKRPIPVPVQSKVWAYGRSLPGNAVSNSAVAWTCICCECCVLSGRILWGGPIIGPEFYRVCDVAE